MKTIKYGFAIAQLFILFFYGTSMLSSSIIGEIKADYRVLMIISSLLGVISIFLLFAIYVMSPGYALLETAKDLEQRRRELEEEKQKYIDATDKFNEMAEKLANALPSPEKTESK